jgi:hypothetical protein
MMVNTVNTATAQRALGDINDAAMFYGLKTLKIKQLVRRAELPGAFAIGGIIMFDEAVAREETARLARERSAFERVRLNLWKAQE